MWQINKKNSRKLKNTITITCTKYSINSHTNTCIVNNLLWSQYKFPKFEKHVCSGTYFRWRSYVGGLGIWPRESRGKAPGWAIRCRTVGNEIRGEPSLAFTYKLNMPYEYTKTCHKSVRQTCCTSIQYSTDGVLISLVQAHLRTIKISALILHNMCKQHFNNHV